MSALDLWHECRRRSITLSLNGERLHYAGSPAAVDPMLPAMKENRDALPACVAALDGALFADGPYWPWGPRITPEQLQRWQRELFDAVDELAKLEGWKPDDYDHTVMCIERQPASTLRPDLAHFTKRLAHARAQAAARDAVDKRAWRFDR